MSIGSITTSGATVSWAAVEGAASYYVHWQPVAGGTEQNLQISGTSVALTNLDACTTYRVRIRTRCGPTDFSDFTAWLPFETASTNPSVSLTVEEAEYGCAWVLSATEGFSHYYWSSNAYGTLYTGDTSSIVVGCQDTIHVVIVDGFGCTGDFSLALVPFPNDCISTAEDENLRNALLADSTKLRNLTRMLSIGMAGISGNDTIKELVKRIALAYQQANCQLYVLFDELIDSCQTYGIDLIGLIQSEVWAHENRSSSDTALIRNSLPYFAATDGLLSELQVLLSFNYLDKSFQNSNYPDWDSLSVECVVAFSGFNKAAQPAFRLVNQAVQDTLLALEDYLFEIPVWQIGIKPKYRNAWITEREFISGIQAACGCIQTSHHEKGEEVCGSGCGGCGAPPCDWHKCSRKERRATRTFQCD